MNICFIADDYGPDKRSNEAIAGVCMSPIVRSVTVIASEACSDSDLFIKSDKALNWGIHLYLTEHAPLTAKLKSLCKNGKAINKKTLVFGLMSGKIRPADIYGEFDSQISRLRGFGRNPQFIDTHQNIHGVPFILRIVRKIAADYGLGNNIRPCAQLSFNLKKTWRSVLSESYSAAMNFQPCSRVLVGCPGYKEKTIGISNALESWDRFIYKVKTRGYNKIFVPCHPGISPAETQLYSSSEFMEMIRKHQIHLTKGVE